jgi:hypothetical protein
MVISSTWRHLHEPSVSCAACDLTDLSLLLQEMQTATAANGATQNCAFWQGPRAWQRQAMRRANLVAVKAAAGPRASGDQSADSPLDSTPDLGSSPCSGTGLPFQLLHRAGLTLAWPGGLTGRWPGLHRAQKSMGTAAERDGVEHGPASTQQTRLENKQPTS